MRYTVSNAAQFYTALASGQLDHDTVKIYAKPLGAMCHFYRDSSGNGHFLSGAVTHDVNDPISQYLMDCDVDDGLMVVGLADNEIRHSGNFSRWLNYAITYNPIDEDWLSRLVIYTTNDIVQRREPDLIRRLVELQEDLENLREAQVRLSINRDFDGLIIVADHSTLGQQVYYMVPSRSAVATVVGIIDNAGQADGLVLRMQVDGRTNIVPTTRVPTEVTDMCYQEARTLIGRQVVLEYTTYLDGDFINNFSSPAVLDI